MSNGRKTWLTVGGNCMDDQLESDPLWLFQPPGLTEQQSDRLLSRRRVGVVLLLSALEVFLNDMRYINPRFTYLLTYLLTQSELFTVDTCTFVV